MEGSGMKKLNAVIIEHIFRMRDISSATEVKYLTAKY